MLSLPLQRVTVLMIITNAYMSDTSTPFTGHKWYNSQNSPMRKVLSLSPLYRGKKRNKTVTKQMGGRNLLLSLFLTNVLSLHHSLDNFFPLSWLLSLVWFWFCFGLVSFQSPTPTHVSVSAPRLDPGRTLGWPLSWGHPPPGKTWHYKSWAGE